MMGCWNEICAVTGVPICAGDEVVMFVPANEYSSDWYCAHAFTLIPAIDMIEFGTYNDYGWIEEIEEDDEDRPDLRSIFVHRCVWDGFISTEPNGHEYFKDSLEEFFRLQDGNIKLGLEEDFTQKVRDRDLLRNYCKFLQHCVDARINLGAPLVFKGSQHYEMETIKHISRLREQCINFRDGDD